MDQSRFQPQSIIHDSVKIPRMLRQLRNVLSLPPRLAASLLRNSFRQLHVCHTEVEEKFTKYFGYLARCEEQFAYRPYKWSFSCSPNLDSVLGSTQVWQMNSLWSGSANWHNIQSWVFVEKKLTKFPKLHRNSNFYQNFYQISIFPLPNIFSF